MDKRGLPLLSTKIGIQEEYSFKPRFPLVTPNKHTCQRKKRHQVLHQGHFQERDDITACSSVPKDVICDEAHWVELRIVTSSHSCKCPSVSLLLCLFGGEDPSWCDIQSNTSVNWYFGCYLTHYCTRANFLCTFMYTFFLLVDFIALDAMMYVYMYIAQHSRFNMMKH